MKKILLLVVISSLVSLAVWGQPKKAPEKKFTDLIGSWTIAGEQNAGASLEILDSTNIILKYMGETRRISNVKIDFSKSPIWFDFTARDTADNQQPIKSLVEIGDSVMKWQLFIDEDRTPSFTSKKGEILYLKKSSAVPTVTASNR